MATLVLTAVGTAVGGPLGGLVGSFLGASIDRRIFGSGAKQQSRAGNIAVQSSAYGEPVPRVYGRMRIAGNLIWCPGIVERQARSGGGKQRSGTGYTYTASFAVALAARRIGAIARIWADGKLVRGSDGNFITATTMRFYACSEDQVADPLIVATEGVDNAPAYRGLAYVVFEDLALADFGNRIPNLTFEIVADAQAPDAALIVTDLFGAAQIPAPVAEGAFPAIHGYVAMHAGSLRSQLEALMPIADLSIADDGSALVVRSGVAGRIVVLPVNDLGTVLPGDTGVARQHDMRGALDTVADAISIGFFDPARDYQLGLQRAVRRAPAVRSEQRDIAVALLAPAAKALAERLLGAALASRTRGEIRLPWRQCSIRVGDTILAGDDPLPWRVRTLSLESMIVALGVERLPSVARQATAGAIDADPGRSLANLVLPNGPTQLHLLDIPALPGLLPTMPRIWLAAAGPEDGWRSTEIEVSLDDGDSYSWLGTINTASTMGVAEQVLAPGPVDLWDGQSTLDVTLLNAAMWLESRSTTAVINGANLALVGDELIQFATATAVAPGRFRLSGLLRGRRGTEVSIGRHAVGERFVMIDTQRLFAFDPPFDTLGRSFRFRAGHRSISPYANESIVPQGQALRPLAPVHLALQAVDGGFVAKWTRRSRMGFVWIDGVDAPLAEESERYRIELWHGGSRIRAAEVREPSWSYSATDRASDGFVAATAFELRVCQISAAVGIGNSVVSYIELG